MSMRRTWLAVLTCLAVALPAAAQEGETGGHEPTMEEWAALAAPGAPHAMLARAAGEWKAETKFWQSATAEPQVSTGTVHSEMLLGGRILHERHAGSMGAEMSFEGVGLTGYDNITRKYWGVWMDSMGTGYYPYEGSYDEASGKLTFAATWPGPNGSTMKVRMMSWSEGDDTRKFEMWQDWGTGEYKAMEATYTRE